MKFVACHECSLRPGLCPGFEGDWGMDGCSVIDHSKCEKYEWTCACNPQRLVERLMEVRGFKCKLRRPLLPIAIDLPHYIPSFYHGFSHEKALELKWVALPLHCLFKSESGDGIKCVAKDGGQLRALLGLHRKTRILLTGPGPDQLIEDFWRFHRHSNLLNFLKELDIQLFTVPNYSFFTDAPPLHHHYNRARILRVAEQSAQAGVFSVLHLNAIHENTWQDWEDLLKNHGEIQHVCMEFQTGYTNLKIAETVLDRLVKVQENVERPLHPILIGAGRHAGFIGKHFASCTIVDAQPFLNTFNRKIHRTLRNGNSGWHFKSTRQLESLIPRFHWNLSEHSERIRQRLEGVHPDRQTEFGFPLDLTGPLFSHQKQKSVAALPLFGQKRSE